MDDNPFRFPPQDAEVEPEQSPGSFNFITFIFKRLGSLFLIALGAFSVLKILSAPRLSWTSIHICVFGAALIGVGVLLWRAAAGEGARILGLLYFVVCGFSALTGWTALFREPSFDDQWWFVALLTTSMTCVSLAGLVAAVKYWKPIVPTRTPQA